MIKGLIAEIGSNHLGSYEKACELIRAAKDSGADYVKLQAIDPKEIIRYGYGSMPFSFYQKCALTLWDYENLIGYGKMLGIPVFYSVFGSAFTELPRWSGGLYKISGSQFRLFSKSFLESWNKETTIVSIPHHSDQFEERAESISNMQPLYVTGYLAEPNFKTLISISKFLNKSVGYSDHTVGIGACVEAFDKFGAPLIEKHFGFPGTVYHDTAIFRDSVHSASPREFEELAKYLQNNWSH